MQNIFGTGTMRTGGSLVLSIMEISNHSKTFCEIFYFSRHIFKKYGNKFDNKILFKLSGEFSLRLFYRNGIKISHKKIFSQLIKKELKTYDDIYIVLSKIISTKVLKNKNTFKNFIDYSNGEWRFVEDFLKLNPKNKSFIVMRDPRSVFSSFKQLTFNKNFSYLNCVFNWTDCAKYFFKYKKKYKKNKFLPLIFEEIHSNPEKNVRKICKFLKTKYEKKYLQNYSFKKIKDKNLIMSAYTDKKIYGFDTKRNNNWLKKLDKWEVYFIEKVCRNYMQKLKYDFVFNKKNKKYESVIKKVLKKNSLIKKRYNNFLKSGNGTHLRTNDPADPKNWTSRHSNTKFKNDPDYKIFKKLNDQILKNSKKIDWKNTNNFSINNDLFI